MNSDLDQLFTKISHDPLVYFSLYNTMIKKLEETMDSLINSPDKDIITEAMRHLRGTTQLVAKIRVDKSTPRALVPPLTAWYDTLQAIYATIGDKLLANDDATFAIRQRKQIGPGAISTIIGKGIIDSSGLTEEIEEYIKPDDVVFRSDDAPITGGGVVEGKGFITQIGGAGSNQGDFSFRGGKGVRKNKKTEKTDPNETISALLRQLDEV